jgi:predicted Co/Zn/Cd cation transporter (cation efflux family)
VFLETQFEETAAKVTREKMVDILRKTVRKMSARGVEEAARLELPEHLRAMLLEAAGVG